MPINKISGLETKPKCPSYRDMHIGQLFTFVNSDILCIRTDEDKYLELKTGILNYSPDDEEAAVNILDRGTIINLEAG